jgi:S-DNA-T family DNA segregation ATPase FtsK/SpoIIIE
MEFINRKRRSIDALREIFFALYAAIVELSGIFMLFMALAAFVATVSYCPEDPSFNTAIDASKIMNVLSYVGSHYADVMIQLFGTSSYIFPLSFMSFGYQMVKYRFVSFFRVVSCLISAVSLSVIAAMHGGKYIETGIVGNWILDLVGNKKYFIKQFSFSPVFFASCILFTVSFIIAIKFNFQSAKSIIEYIRSKLIAALEKRLTKVVGEFSGIESTYFKQYSKKNSKKALFSEKNNFTSVNDPKKGFILPPLSLLREEQSFSERLSDSELRNMSQKLINVLKDFGIDGEIGDVKSGPVVTLCELKPAAGIKSSRIIGLSDDIARYMSAVSARVAVIPGRNALGIELPNTKRQIVYLREILQSNIYTKSPAALPIALGKDISGGSIVIDLSKTPHLLIAGTTGSGKSVGINAMILSLLYRLSPDECKFIMIDPKMLELSVYDDIPHLLTPVVTDPKKAVIALKWAVKEMESRYKAMSKIGVRNIEGYNSKISELKGSGENITRKVHTGFDPDSGAPIYEEQVVDVDVIPYIVVIVDEMADLMLVAGKEIEIAVQRLAQMARAAGIHLMMATQRPSVDVITGTIKANFPTRISFQVSSKIDSRTILGEQGAEQLLGQGDMLYMASGGRTTRIHCPFVSDAEVENVVTSLKEQGEPRYVTSILEDEDENLDDDYSNTEGGDDPMYKEAVTLILREGKASTSFLQRHLKIGYNRAARIIDMMETAGIVSPANHVGKREILGR